MLLRIALGAFFVGQTSIAVLKYRKRRAAFLGKEDVTDSEIDSVGTDLGIENGLCNKLAQEETPEAQEEEPIAEDEASEPQAPTVIPDNILQESGCLHNQDGNKIVTDDHKPSKDVVAKGADLTQNGKTSSPVKRGPENAVISPTGLFEALWSGARSLTKAKTPRSKTPRSSNANERAKVQTRTPRDQNSRSETPRIA